MDDTTSTDIDDVLAEPLADDETLTDRSRDTHQSVYVGGAGR